MTPIEICQVIDSTFDRMPNQAVSGIKIPFSSSLLGTRFGAPNEVVSVPQPN